MRGTREAVAALCCLAIISTTACGGDSEPSEGSTNVSTSAEVVRRTTDLAADDLGPIENPFDRPIAEAHPGARVDQLIVRDVVRGDGAELRVGDIALMDFLNSDYVDGGRINSTWGRRPYALPITQDGALPAFWQGLPGMRVGGRRILIVPPGLGYRAAHPTIPNLPDRTLFFVVDLLGITREDVPAAQRAAS